MWKGKGAAKGYKGVQQPMFQAAPAGGGGGFKTVMCRFFMQGTCQKGDGCTFSHGEEEGAAMPAAFAPQQGGQTPCKFFAQGMCHKGDACTFSHGGGGAGIQLGKGGGKGGGFGGMKGAASPVMQHGQAPCRFFAMGTCAKGWQCPFSHGGGAAKGGAFGGKGKDGFGGKGKDGKSKNKGKGHLLPRTRISEAPFSGTVVEWKGKYGWIQPAEAIEHEKAEKHGGRLFFSQDSIVGGVAVDAGATVEYHIFEDVSGIGAEEVTVF